MPLLSLPCRYQTPNGKQKYDPRINDAWRVKEALIWLNRLDSWLRRGATCGCILPADADISLMKDKREQRICNQLRQYFESEGVIQVLRNAISLLLLQQNRETPDKLRRIQSKLCCLEKEHRQQEAALYECIADTHSLAFKASILSKVKEQMAKYQSLVASLADELHYLLLEGWTCNHDLLEYLKEQINYLWMRVAAYEDLYLRLLKCGERCAVVPEAQLEEIRTLLQAYNLEIADFNMELTGLLRDDGLTEQDPSVRRLQHLLRARFTERHKVLRLYLHCLQSGGVEFGVTRCMAELQQAVEAMEGELLGVGHELTCLLLDNCPANNGYVRHLKYILQYLTNEEQMLQFAGQEVSRPKCHSRVHREKLLVEFNWLLETHDRQSVALGNHLASMESHGCLQDDELYHEMLEDLVAQRRVSKLQYLQLYLDFLRVDSVSHMHDLPSPGLDQHLSSYCALMRSVQDEINMLMLSGSLPADDPFLQQMQQLHSAKLQYMESCADLCGKVVVGAGTQSLDSSSPVCWTTSVASGSTASG